MAGTGRRGRQLLTPPTGPTSSPSRRGPKVPDTQKVSGWATARNPRPRSRWPHRAPPSRACAACSPGCRTLPPPFRWTARLPATPALRTIRGNRLASGLLGLPRASAQVRCRVRPKGMCWSPDDRHINVIEDRQRGADLHRVNVEWTEPGPSATASRDQACVFPNIDSYTTSPRISSPPSPASISPVRPPESKALFSGRHPGQSHGGGRGRPRASRSSGQARCSSRCQYGAVCVPSP